MEGKTLEEWIKFYEKKSNVEYVPPDKRLKRYFFADKGFAEIGIADSKDMVIVHQLCGDVRFWKKVAEVIATEHDINHLGTWCIRKIEPYIRFFGVEIVERENLGEGLTRYHGRFKDTGKSAMFTPDFRAKNGNIGYLVTWEI